MEKEEKVIERTGVTSEEYAAWEKMKKQQQEDKHIPDPSQENVESANEISIVDYARKNGLKILSESVKTAKIEDPATKKEIKVNKVKNTWSGFDLDGEREGGRLIRFYTKVNRIYPSSNEEWIGHIQKLCEEKNKYKTNEEYNKEYKDIPNKEPDVVEKRKKRSRQPETVLANSISIMDIAKKQNYEILSEDDKIAKIKDVQTDGVLTVRKDTNKWTGRDADGRFISGKTIRFVARMKGIEEISARDSLLENRAKYITSEEYNESYKASQDTEREKEALKEKPEIKEEKAAENNTGNRYYAKEQLAEIIAGTKKGIDIQSYAKLELNPKQMRQIRLGLEKGINLSSFAFPNVPAEYVKEVRLAARDGLDTSIFQLKDGECVFTAEQAKEIRMGLRNELTPEQISIFARKELSPDVMHELRIGIQNGFDVMKEFNTGHYKAQDIHIIRMNLKVRSMMAFLKEKLAMACEFVSAAFFNAIQRQVPGMPAEEAKAEAEQETRDIVRNLCGTIEESLSERNMDDQKEILAGLFQKVVAIGNAIERISPEKDRADSIENAAEKCIEAIQEKELKQSSLESLKAEYIEQFRQNEQKYNESVAEFSMLVNGDKNLTREQRAELLRQTVGREFGEKALENIMEYLPEMPEQETNPHLLQNEIMEYYEDFEMEP